VVLSLLLVAVGVVLLARAADEFVEGAVRLARHFDVSKVVIGAVIVGFGTSAPEMLVSSFAAVRGRVDVGVGNVIGSNIANLTLVLGAAALFAPVAVGRPTLRREGPMSVLAVLAFGWAVQGGVTALEGVLLMVGLGVALFISIVGARHGVELDERTYSVPLEATRTVVGLLVTVLGAQLLIEGALDLADRAGIAEGFVGLTLVAVGTSLPEMVTSVIAARRGETGLIIGNLLGSNIFNSFAVGGLLGLLGPGNLTDPSMAGTPVVLMVGVALGVFALLSAGGRVQRREGLVLLAVFAAAIPLLPR